jgi:hypothetical protein
MAIYRFKISFEDYDDVVREIDIKSNQTFMDLHYAFQSSVGYDPEKPSSFYVSNDHWIKNEEIAYLPNDRKIERGVSLMEDAKLSRFIDDPHQKFYYIYNFEKPFDFHVELIKILEKNPSQTYPYITKSTGEAPKIFANILVTPEDSVEDDDMDFIDDDTVLIADEDELSSLNTDTEESDSEEENDEFADEFSDNEGYDEEDYQDRDE